MTLTRLVHLSLLRCWLVYVSAEIDHLSQSEQSIRYRNISLKLPTTGNYDFTYVCFGFCFFNLKSIHFFCGVYLIRVMGAAGVCPSSCHGNAGYTNDRKTKVSNQINAHVFGL